MLWRGEPDRANTWLRNYLVQYAHGAARLDRPRKRRTGMGHFAIPSASLHATIDRRPLQCCYSANRFWEHFSTRIPPRKRGGQLSRPLRRLGRPAGKEAMDAGDNRLLFGVG